MLDSDVDKSYFIYIGIIRFSPRFKRHFFKKAWFVKDLDSDDMLEVGKYMSELDRDYKFQQIQADIKVR